MTGGLSRFGAIVYVGPARWQLRSQLVIKPGVLLVCDPATGEVSTFTRPYEQIIPGDRHTA